MKGRTTKIKGVLTVLTTGEGGGGKQLDHKNGGGLIVAHLLLRPIAAGPGFFPYTLKKDLPFALFNLPGPQKPRRNYLLNKYC